MRKFVLSILLVALILVSSINVGFAEDGIKKGLKFNAYCIENYDDYGKNLNLDNSVACEIDIDLFQIIGDKVCIEGFVDRDGKKEFKLQGGLGLSRISNSKYVGNLKDENNNYEVVYFGIENDPKASLSFDKKLKTYKAPLTKIYLKDMENKNLIILESDKIIKQNEIAYIETNVVDIAQHVDEYWYAKILKPYDIQIINLPLESDSPMRIAVPKSTTRLYKHLYNWMGYDFEERFTLAFDVVGVSEITQSDLITSTMRLAAEETLCPNNPAWNDTDTSFVVGLENDTEVTFNVGSPNVGIIKATWSTTYYKPPVVTAKVSWGWNSYDYNVGPVNFGIGYTAEDTCVQDGYFENLQSITKQYGHKRNTYVQIKDTVHKFFTNVYVSNFGNNTQYTSSYFTVKFNYNVTNGAGGSIFSKNDSVSLQFYYTVSQ